MTDLKSRIKAAISESGAERDRLRHETVREADRHNLFDASSVARGFNAGWDDHAARLQPIIDRLIDCVEALEKISQHETLGDDKYVSYERAWHGVAKYARDAIEALEQVLPRGGSE